MNEETDIDDKAKAITGAKGERVIVLNLKILQLILL